MISPSEKIGSVNLKMKGRRSVARSASGDHMSKLRILFFLFGFVASACAHSVTISRSTSTAGPIAEARLNLSCLQPACHLERRWMGIVPTFPWGAWLVCGDSSMLVVHPWNLIDNVSVTNLEQALEYVRLFTSYHTFGMFHLNGALEVRSGDAEWLEVLAKSSSVARLFHDPEVAQSGLPGTREFRIRRIIVNYDQELMEVTELVRENGFYSIESQELILQDIRELGFIHRVI